MKKFNLRYTGVAMSIMAMTALATANTANAQDATETVVVKGTRATIQSSIDQKRISTEIVDGLSADEIGDIPALSIGEALETLTGVSSNRENGGASEIAIRGLGSFLTNTVLNGRESTNGAGNRAVNFSIFPSELFNKVGVFKTQSANFIEGAVAGQVRLDTKRPLDHGKRDIQISAKAAYAEEEQDVRGGQDVGYRGTISYIDQFETEKYGDFGISLGGQIRDESNPEQEFTRSNTPRICALNGPASEGGRPTGTTCQDGELSLRAPDAQDRDFLFTSNSAQFRQNVTDDERNSFFGAVQWRPNDKLNINLDGQWSERIQNERRTDLVFAETNRSLDNDNTVVSDSGFLESFANVSDVELNSGDDDFGQEEGGQEIQLLGQDFERDETYKGIGLNIEYQVNDNLKVSFDASYANTFRIEQERSIRLGDQIERVVTGDFTGGGVGSFSALNSSARDTDGDGVLDTFISGNTITDPNNPFEAFDASDLGEFITGATRTGEGTDAAVVQALRDALLVGADGDNGNGVPFEGIDVDVGGRLRLRSQEDTRENTITALRGDFELQTENLGFVTSVEGGVRFSQLEYDRRGNINNDFTLTNFDNYGEVVAAIANNCIDEPFESDFTEVSSEQNELFINNTLSPDAACAFDIARQIGIIDENTGEGITDQLDPITGANGGSISVEEDTFAAYLQANFESTLFGLPARGNFGVRLVNTSVDTRTFNTPFALDFNDAGSFELDSQFTSEDITENNDSFSYTELLPSATLVLDLSDTVILRTGIFRGISRSDPALLGSRQVLGTVQQSIADQITVVTAAEATGTDLDSGDVLNITEADIAGFLTAQGTTGGATDLEAFTSWNVDLALEWYPNKDTILAAGVYYKKFRGGYQNVFENSTFTITGDGSTDTNDALLATNLFNGADSIDVTAPISSFETTSESSNLYGIELTASHSFSYLPGFLGGFGGKLSYNYASSDFEFEDDFAGEGVAADGTQLVGLTAPADIFGLSRNVASAQLYWSGERLDFQLIGKHRSNYFQQFVDTPGRIRFVDDNTVFEFRASYQVNDAVKLSFEALNITDEERTDFRAIDGNIANVNSFGPRYFVGIKAKL